MASPVHGGNSAAATLRLDIFKESFSRWKAGGSDDGH
jgi:hypothetical protein